MAESYSTARADVSSRGDSAAPTSGTGYSSKSTAPSEFAKQPGWAPRIWSGCNLRAWLKLLVRNRFAVAPRYWHIAIIITIISLANTLLRLVEAAIYGRAVGRTEVRAPIFVLGHWRSGTTLLHELMVCDQRFGYPTSYQCLEPNHFLLTERVLKPCLGLLMPTTRPMDNMKFDLDRPQEDEFALCLVGAESAYLNIAFPNNSPKADDHLDLEAVTPASRCRWMREFHGFLQKVAYKTGKRLVLKSPPHTARIKTLQKMFPDAIFIHIVRDPYVVFSSTVNLWQTLHKTQGLQTPTNLELQEKVLSTFVRMYDKLEDGKASLRPDQFYELTYEDLIKDPVAEMKKIYDHFGIGGFPSCLPKLESYLAANKSYETNLYKLSEVESAMIAKRWNGVIRRYGYAKL
jgi:hypothetical protein